jgi:hypothetical protein
MLSEQLIASLSKLKTVDSRHTANSISLLQTNTLPLCYISVSCCIGAPFFICMLMSFKKGLTLLRYRRNTLQIRGGKAHCLLLVIECMHKLTVFCLW